MQIDVGRLIDALPGLVWTTTPEGASDFINQRWREYAGLTLEEVRGAQGWKSAIHPDDIQLTQGRWEALIASGEAGEVEARLRRFDGEYRRFSIKTSPMTDASGGIVGWCGINTDIEDRRRAEEAVLAHERRFQLILDGLPAIAALFSPTGKIIFCNRRTLEYLDETLEQIQSKASAYNFHSDERDEVLSDWSASLRTGRPFDREARLCRADGVYRWHRTMVFPLRDAAGEIELWYGLSVDIEDTKRAEAKLAAEKRLLELVAMAVPLPEVLEELCRQVEQLAPGCTCSILLVDRGGATFQVGAGPSLPASYNAVFEGKTIDPAYGPCSLAVTLKAPVATIDPASDPRWAQSAWPALMAEHGLRSCRSRPILSAGRDVIGAFAVYRRAPESADSNEQELIDRFTHIAGIAIERAQADAAFRANEAELRQAYHHLTEAQRLSQTGSFTWDMAADEHNWSDETYRIWEIAPQTKITVETLLAAIHPEDLPSVEEVLGRAAAGREFELVFRIVAGHGAVKHIHAVGHRMQPITDRLVFLGAIQDVTERKLAEEALSRARAELSHMARVTTLSALTASIAHEVNQPLAGIITNASTCLRMLAADPPNVEGAKATAQRTIRDGNRASDVIQRLRQLFARRLPSMEPVDLNDAAREVLALSSSDLQSRRVVLYTDFARDLPLVSGDRVQLQQVILNLVLNAADAMSNVDDRPRDLRITTRCDEAGQVSLSVCDAGAGIEPQNLERLFDAFYTTKAEGMGVGLSISRSIIQGHEGRLWATANDGPGATFVVALPRAELASDPDEPAQGARHPC